MTEPAEIVTLLLRRVPKVPFAELGAEGNVLTLSYEGRVLTTLEVTATERPASWAVTRIVNDLAHGALFRSGIQDLPPGESLNAAHQVVEWWDAALCALGRLAPL
jgi:hypothetical protein